MDTKKLVAFLSLWVGNALMLLISSVIFGDNVVLGNDRLAKPVASVFSSLLLTVIISLVPWVVNTSGTKVKNENIRLGIFLVANIGGIWLIKRFAQITGLGIANIFFVVVLAVLATIVQWATAKVAGVPIDKKSR